MTRARLANVLMNFADDYEEERMFDEVLKFTAAELRAKADAVEQSSMTDEEAEVEIVKVAAKYKLP